MREATVFCDHRITEQKMNCSVDSFLRFLLSDFDSKNVIADFDFVTVKMLVVEFF